MKINYNVFISQEIIFDIFNKEYNLKINIILLISTYCNRH